MFPLLWQYKDEVKTMAQAFFGGVHPNDMKAATNEKAIEQLQAPAQVVIPMSMHFGAPCTPTVSKGDYVKLGQKIGEFKGLGAPIHASVSGTVAAVEPRPYSMGGKVMSVVIDNDFKDDLSEEVHAPADPDALSVEEMVEMVKQAGIVGMGGATFPTHTKISSGIGKVDTVIINGAECEPYITSDDRLMRETPERVVGGLRVVLQILQPKRAAIGIEQNKPEAIAAISAVLGSGIDLLPLHVRYPQGAEKQLIQTVTGRCVPPGGLPAHVGCAVFNAATCAAIYDAVYLGLPLVRRAVTVTGSAIAKPGNFLAPIGTAYSDLVEAAGGFALPPYKVLCGGPMMGIAQYTLRTATIKGNNALTCYSDKDRHETPNPHCIRCGKCVEACPMHLMPLFLHRAVNRGDLERLDELHVMDCIECGSCAYGCPAGIPLVQSFRTGKKLVRDAAAREKAKKEAAAK